MDTSQTLAFEPLRSAENPKPHNAPLEPTTTPPLAVIALSRISFGLRPGDIDDFNALGATDIERLTAYVDQQLDPASIDDTTCDALVAASDFPTIDLSLTSLWLDYVRDPDNLTFANQGFLDVERLALLRAVHSKRQLFEQMVDFWHNHFNVYGFQFIIQSVFPDYTRVIRASALGNFRTLLETVTKHTAMLYYLDNYTSSSAGPNENFGRELFELHTMGAAAYLGSGLRQFEVPDDENGFPIGYVDDDVYETTRCFTGWTLRNAPGNPTIGDTGEFYYRDDWHDRFQKFVLGSYIPANQAALYDGQHVLDLLAAHPATARHISTKLIRRFVTDNPPESLIASTAAVFPGAGRCSRSACTGHASHSAFN